MTYYYEIFYVFLVGQGKIGCAEIENELVEFLIQQTAF